MFCDSDPCQLCCPQRGPVSDVATSQEIQWRSRDSVLHFLNLPSAGSHLNDLTLVLKWSEFWLGCISLKPCTRAKTVSLKLSSTPSLLVPFLGLKCFFLTKPIQQGIKWVGRLKGSPRRWGGGSACKAHSSLFATASPPSERSHSIPAIAPRGPVVPKRDSRAGGESLPPLPSHQPAKAGYMHKKNIFNPRHPPSYRWTWISRYRAWSCHVSDEHQHDGT